MEGEAGARRDQPADNGILLQAPQQRGVAGLLDLDLTQHLQHEHLDVPVVEFDALWVGAAACAFDQSPSRDPITPAPDPGLHLDQTLN